jgi:hypothetical protein
MGSVLKPDVGKLLYLAIGFLVVPRLLSMIGSR